MNTTQQDIARDCIARSSSGRADFGETVAQLRAAGFERYHADYSRMDVTFYTPEGESCVVPMAIPAAPIADAFTAAEIERSVRQSQRGEIKYPQFTRQVFAAGCIGYFVQLAGGCVQYFGRRGELHTEWFPGQTGDH